MTWEKTSLPHSLTITQNADRIYVCFFPSNLFHLHKNTDKNFQAIEKKNLIQIHTNTHKHTLATQCVIHLSRKMNRLKLVENDWSLN